MGYQSAYKQVSISTANPSRLLLMMFDGLIRFVRQAIYSFSSDDMESGHKALLRAQNVVLELRSTLKPEYAPELSESLADLYSYFYEQFVQANIEKSSVKLEAVLPMIVDLHDAFSQATIQIANEGE